MKSIIQKDKDKCFLCNRTMLYGLEEHHCIHGIANRKLSEQYGLKVYLCPECHRTGKYAVHNCKETDIKLKIIAQRKFEEEYPLKDFIKIFGRSYI